MRARTRQAVRCCYEAIWDVTAGAGCAVGMLVAVRTNGALVVASIFVTTTVLAAMAILPWLPDLEWRARPFWSAHRSADSSWW